MSGDTVVRITASVNIFVVRGPRMRIPAGILHNIPVKKNIEIINPTCTVDADK